MFTLTIGVKSCWHQTNKLKLRKLVMLVLWCMGLNVMSNLIINVCKPNRSFTTFLLLNLEIVKSQNGFCMVDNQCFNEMNYPFACRDAFFICIIRERIHVPFPFNLFNRSSNACLGSPHPLHAHWTGPQLQKLPPCQARDQGCWIRDLTGNDAAIYR